MCKDTIIENRTRQSGRARLPDIPSDQWCDFRKDFEAGMSLHDIAEKYLCDARTVKRLMLLNRSSSEIGRQMVPTKLEPFIERMDLLYDWYIEQKAGSGICELSRMITDDLVDEGYTGGERTVRNYLRSRYQYVTDPDKPEKGNCND